MAGGPMYYLEHGLKQKWLGVLFAIFGAFAAFGIGNGTQAKAVADAMNNTFSVPFWVTGIALVIFAGLVILGGIKWIGRVTSFFVPIMAFFYLITGIIIMVMNFNLVPEAFASFLNLHFQGKLLQVVPLVLLSALVLHAGFSLTKQVLVLLQLLLQRQSRTFLDVKP